MSLEFAEGAVTRLRREFKLVLAPERAVAICERLSLEMGGESHPTLVTSIYFDRPGLPLAARAVATPHDCLKVRTKEYFPDLGADGEDRVVLEIKRERYGLTKKRRVWISRRRLRSALFGQAWLSPLILRGRLVAALAVTYVRHVWQQTEAWRVTVDTDVRFYPVATQLALSPRRVGPKDLGRCVHREERVVIEVKHAGAELPAWLYELQASRTRYFSKFVFGMGRLYPMQAEGLWG
ncbi:MAG: VTC domain-containing protein [Myxococcales bacterium]|nr:VTC domain-containing protein [Myxococcales bacterium]